MKEAEGFGKKTADSQLNLQHLSDNIYGHV
jgi:hypothetical protein